MNTDLFSDVIINGGFPDVMIKDGGDCYSIAFSSKKAIDTIMADTNSGVLGVLYKKEDDNRTVWLDIEKSIQNKNKAIAYCISHNLTSVKL